MSDAEWIGLILALFGPDAAVEEMQRLGVKFYQEICKLAVGTD